LRRARAIALHDRDREASLPLRLKERLHRDGLESHAVDVAQRWPFGARIVRDGDVGTRQRREGDDAREQRARSRPRDQQAASGPRWTGGMASSGNRRSMLPPPPKQVAASMCRICM
jgi:hypothetical protein